MTGEQPAAGADQLGGEDAPPPRSRGVIALLEENCTVCMLCARECPDWCIWIDSHKQTEPALAPGGRPRVTNQLDRFAIDYSLCMYCGICVDVCPFDALFWSPEAAPAEPGIAELVHERDRLRDWMWTVPAPPPLDAAAEPTADSPVQGTADPPEGTADPPPERTAEPPAGRGRPPA